MSWARSAAIGGSFLTMVCLAIGLGSWAGIAAMVYGLPIAAAVVFEVLRRRKRRGRRIRQQHK